MPDYEPLRKQLLKMKEEAEQAIDHSGDPLMDKKSLSEATGELSLYDNHPADLGEELNAREEDMALLFKRRRELEDIEHALGKFEKGTYGIDEVSGKKIPFERLQAVPTAKTSVENAAHQQVISDRPAEEEVISEIETIEGDATDYLMNAYNKVAEFNENSMVEEGSSLIDEETSSGYAEDIEAFAATGIDGYHGDEEIMILSNDKTRDYIKTHFEEE